VLKGDRDLQNPLIVKTAGRELPPILREEPMPAKSPAVGAV